jgi:hypothetical protein
VRWVTLRRETGLIEHVCEHGVGHPNDGSIQYMNFIEDLNKRQAEALESGEDCIDRRIPDGPFIDKHWGIHGCDGCCDRKDFPGSAIGAIQHALERIKNEAPDSYHDLKYNHYLLWWGLMAAVSKAQRDGVIG